MSNEVPQWEPPSDFFDQSGVDYLIPDIDWRSLESDQFGNEYTIPPTNLSPASTQHSPESLTKISADRDLEPKASKPKRGRRIRDELEKDNETAADRRRAQVRLAQRAYRDRKEATVTSLQRENENLKKRLLGMESVSDQLLRLTYSLPNLPESARSTTQSLHKWLLQYRPSPEKPPAVDATPRNDIPPTSSDTGAVGPYISIHTFTGHRMGSPSRGFQDIQVLPHMPQPQHSINQIPQISNIWQNISTPTIPTTFSPRNSIESPIPFPLRLRHEALKGAYELVSAPSTSYQHLCKVFRYCIFTCTRDEIRQHLNHLLTDSHYTPEFPSLEAEERDAYIDPEGVCRYLSEKGLAIDPGSPYAHVSNFSMPVATRETARVTTIFDEMQQREKIVISVHVLLCELLARMVCLVVGPGIQASKIDEAIRSTVIASI